MEARSDSYNKPLSDDCASKGESEGYLSHPGNRYHGLVSWCCTMFVRRAEKSPSTRKNKLKLEHYWQSHASLAPWFASQHFDAMAAQENLPRLPRKVVFRVLIIGRANAGKTSILQRICDTTESPVIYSVDSSGTRKQVRSPSKCHLSISSSSQIQLEPSMEVRRAYPCRRWLIVTILLAAWPAQHRGRNYLRKSQWLCFPRLPRI